MPISSEDTSWGGVAGWYDGLLEQSASSYQAEVILPNVLRIIEPKADMNVLDIACGQGYFSRAFASKGAKVVGCDISAELIALAQKHSTKNVSYHVSPADKLTLLGATKSAGTFDVAAIILAIQNIENLVGTFSECARALKKDGRLLIVLNHPAFRIPGRSSWQWDELGKKQYRRVDGYMSDDRMKIDMTPGEKDPSKKRFTTSFHRPLQVYIKTLSKAGFAVTRCEEWVSHKKSQKGPRGEEEDRMRGEIPMFLGIEAVKIR